MFIKNYFGAKSNYTNIFILLQILFHDINLKKGKFAHERDFYTFIFLWTMDSLCSKWSVN